MSGLHWYTVNGLLRSVLETTMQRPEFSQFRLVGGTALSLQLGHRLSVDIDLFTDALYGTVDFNAIESSFKVTYPYVYRNKGFMSIGVSFTVGNSENDSVKVDLYYEEPFVFPMIELDNIGLASKEEINAMKLEVISKKGRKKEGLLGPARTGESLQRAKDDRVS